MFVIEEILNRAADAMGVDSTALRCSNSMDRPHVTPRHTVGHRVNRLPQLVPQLMKDANYDERKRAIEQFNRSGQHVKRGIGFQPVKFGISFTASLLNQAGALSMFIRMEPYKSITAGPKWAKAYTKMIAVAADTLGVELGAVRLMTTATDKVPNTFHSGVVGQ